MKTETKKSPHSAQAIEAAIAAVIPADQRLALDGAVKLHTVDRSFAAFIAACHASYTPSIYTRPAHAGGHVASPETYASATILADAFDATMAQLGDARRAYRGFNAADVKREARAASR